MSRASKMGVDPYDREKARHEEYMADLCDSVDDALSAFPLPSGVFTADTEGRIAAIEKKLDEALEQFNKALQARQQPIAERQPEAFEDRLAALEERV